MNDEKTIQSLGGEARAKALTSDERKAIAQDAAQARWSAEGKKRYPKALNQGELKIGNMVIPCAVLDNGERVISDRTLALSLGIRGAGAYWKKKKKGEGALLPEYVSPSYLQPFISEEAKAKFSESITYNAKQGGIANGSKATILPEICDIWIKAKESGALEKIESAQDVAAKAYLLLRAFATVGIIALIDEATGYQEVRDREALQEILRKYISDALLKWAETFPIEFYKEIFRLKGWAWNSGKMPPVVGKYVNDLVYDRLAPGVLAELQNRNPVTDKGYRRYQHHRFLTRDIGHPELKRRLYELVGMARASESWDRFYRLVDRTFPRVNTTMALALND